MNLARTQLRRASLALGLLVAASAMAQAVRPSTRRASTGAASNLFDGGIQIRDYVSNAPFMDLYPQGAAGTNDGYVWRIHTPQQGPGGADWGMRFKDAYGYDGGDPFGGDSVMEWGYNIRQTDEDKPQWSLNLESYFQDLSEFHLAWLGPADGSWSGKPSPRVISAQVTNSTGHADLGHQVDRFYLQDSTGTIQPFVWDMTSTSASATINNGAYLFFSGNNYTPLYQEGADGNARALLFLDSNERVQLAPFGSAGLPADTTISDTGGSNPSGPATVTRVNGSAVTAVYGLEVGAATLSGGGSVTLSLHFASGTPTCTCSDQTSAAACSPGTPAFNSLALTGTGSHVVAYQCVGVK